MFQKGDWLCARCLEHDFVVQAKTLQQLSRALQLFIVGHIAVRLRNLATDGSGGGVFASAAVAIINSTLTGNRTNFGGGGLAGGSGIIVNTTIANNDGGFSGDALFASSALALYNTIAAGSLVQFGPPASVARSPRWAITCSLNPTAPSHALE